MTDSERQTRIDLAACYRACALFGWDDLVFTHISARVPDTTDQFLINPYGMLFEEITASSLIKVDAQGNKLEDSPYDTNPAGFLIHSAIHEARADAHCVVHLHSLDGVAVSAQKQGLQPYSQQSLLPLSNLAYHDYEGIVLNPEEKARLVAHLGDCNFMILRNHGLLTCASSVADAFLFMYVLNAACTIQIRAQAGGGELIPVDQRIVDGIRSQVEQVTRAAGGALAWPGILRRLDRRLPGYAD